jgi:aldose 1-epimerase
VDALDQDPRRPSHPGTNVGQGHRPRGRPGRRRGPAGRRADQGHNGTVQRKRSWMHPEDPLEAGRRRAQDHASVVLKAHHDAPESAAQMGHRQPGHSLDRGVRHRGWPRAVNRTGKNAARRCPVAHDREAIGNSRRLLVTDETHEGDLMTPSGYQIEISHRDQRLCVVEVGGGIREYTVAGQAVIDGYRADEMCSSGRGQILAPWPNRLEDGTYRFDGRDHQLGLSEPANHNAIHGLVRFANWVVTDASSDAAILTYWLHPQPGYPFSVELRVHYRLGDAGLSVALEAINRGDEPCPFGAGAHPYVRVGSGPVDALILQSPARTRYDNDERGLPLAQRPVAGSTVDFRTGRVIGPDHLDTAFTDLERDADGRARITLDDARTGQQVAVWLDEAYSHLMLFTGDTLGDVARRRHGLAVEPMTCAPNAFHTGDGLLVIAPGEAFRATWGISTSGFSER